MGPIRPEQVRYIKQGVGDRWARHAFDNESLEFGFPSLPHSLCLECLESHDKGDPEAWDAVSRFFRDVEGKSPGKATDNMREVRDFYTLGEECLWVTFAFDRLWWCFADTPVEWHNDPYPETQGSRYRRLSVNWQDCDINGTRLTASNLSSKLTRVAAYRQTICTIAAEGYLLRKINGVTEPSVLRGQSARAELLAATEELITGLHWSDFEVLVDLLFVRSGWQRISKLGGTLKDADLIIEQPATGERALVQVKSSANQQVLDDYIGRFESSGQYDRLFFVCHTKKGKLEGPEEPQINVWEKQALSRSVVAAGLFDWLLERAA